MKVPTVSKDKIITLYIKQFYRFYKEESYP